MKIMKVRDFYNLEKKISAGGLSQQEQQKLLEYSEGISVELIILQEKIEWLKNQMVALCDRKIIEP